MTELRIADVSEFQSNVDAPAYLGAGYPVIICRTHNGYRPDKMMSVRRDYLRRYRFTALGWYQYLAADRDPVAQAHEFLHTLGELRPNEFAVLDHEEGHGEQSARAAAWFRVVDAWCGFPAMLYAGQSFLRTQLGGSGRWRGRPIWIAAYPQSFRDDRRAEPPDPHLLWQFSDRFRFAGITGPSDASVHHGTAAEFFHSVRGAQAARRAVPVPDLPEAADMPTLTTYVTADHRIGFVVLTQAGEVKHIEQQHAPGTGNADFWRTKDGKPEWLTLGKP